MKIKSKPRKKSTVSTASLPDIIFMLLIFFMVTTVMKTFDGLKVHSSGNIFTTGPNGILIISPKGVLIATINYGKPITNCNFDTNEEYLYVTGFNDISRIKLK